MKLLVMLLALIMVSCSKEKIRINLVPNGYQGALVIIEDSNSKLQPITKGDTIYFDFTKSNIIRSNGKFIEGYNSLKNNKYYYINDNGTLDEIPIAYAAHPKLDSSIIYLYLNYTQIRKGSQCELISSPKMLNKYARVQLELCNSLFAIRP